MSDLEKSKKNGSSSFKTRYVFVIMMVLCHFNAYTLRNNINVAIVAMVNSTSLEELESSNSSGLVNACPERNPGNTTSIDKDGPFSWSSVDQGLILGCYFYGYVCGQVPGAWLARKYGLRYVNGLAFFISSVLTLVTPVVAYFSYELLVALRILLGLIQGVIFPAFVGGVGVWCPPEERSTTMALSLSGQMFGIVATNALGGLISQNLGWEYVFYITGGFVLCWTALWFGLVYDSPQDHPRISGEEKLYIMKSLNIKESKSSKGFAVSWKKILTSPEVFAITISVLCSGWSDYTLQIMLPSYMATIQNFDLAASGFLSALPFLCELVVIIGIGPITDMLLKRKLLTVLQARKIATAVSIIFPALFYVLAGYSGCNVTLVLVYFSLAASMIGVSVVGMRANVLDIAPLCSGVVVSYTNTVGNISGFAAPQVATAFLKSGNTIKNWQKIFWLAGGLSVLGTLVFILLAGGHELPWAKAPETKEKPGKVNEAYSSLLLNMETLVEFLMTPYNKSHI